MNKRTQNIILIIILIVVLSGVGYFMYTVYAENQTQTYMIQAMQHNNTARNQISQAETYINREEYDNAVSCAETAKNEYQLAIDANNNAMNYASGVHKDYITYDILRLQANIKLATDEIKAINSAKQNDISGVLSANADSEQYTAISRTYRGKEDEVSTANPDKFKFLFSS